MRFLATLLCISSLSILMMACPLMTNIPLVEEPQADVPHQQLVGEWEVMNTPTDAIKVLVKSRDSTKYILYVVEHTGTYDIGKKFFNLWTTKIDTANFLVIQSWKKKEEFAIYHLFQNNDSTVTLSNVKLPESDLRDLKTSNELRNAIAARMKRWGAITDPIMYRRIK